jgi:hypothetical protein
MNIDAYKHFVWSTLQAFSVQLSRWFLPFYANLLNNIHRPFALLIRGAEDTEMFSCFFSLRKTKRNKLKP